MYRTANENRKNIINGIITSDLQPIFDIKNINNETILDIIITYHPQDFAGTLNLVSDQTLRLKLISRALCMLNETNIPFVFIPIIVLFGRINYQLVSFIPILLNRFGNLPTL